jgi:hypothetical protein
MPSGQKPIAPVSMNQIPNAANTIPERFDQHGPSDDTDNAIYGPLVLPEHLASPPHEKGPDILVRADAPPFVEPRADGPALAGTRHFGRTTWRCPGA